jgi:hypothetical protein
MSRTVYNYTVEVLKKVSFNPKLFKRELEKASKKTLTSRIHGVNDLG